jgi:hypothetical protein
MADRITIVPRVVPGERWIVHSWKVIDSWERAVLTPVSASMSESIGMEKKELLRNIIEHPGEATQF